MLSLKEFYQQKRDLMRWKSRLRKEILPKWKKSSIFSFKKTRRNLKKRENQGILHVKSSFNNTIVAFTDLKGKVYSVRSAGSCGFHGKKKRSTKFAIESTLNSMADQVKDSNVRGVFLFLKGFSRSRHYLLKCLKKKNLKLLGIRDLTPNPHNGCRPKKLRRG